MTAMPGASESSAAAVPLLDGALPERPRNPPRAETPFTMDNAPSPTKSQPESPPNSRWLTRGVLGIGLASLFSDWGHEAATSILPAFLASLGAPACRSRNHRRRFRRPLEFRETGRRLDRRSPARPKARRRHRLFRHGHFHVWLRLCSKLAGRLRPARLRLARTRQPRPVARRLLSDSVAPEKLGSAFGFERAMDTVGAVLGPLCATALVTSWGVRGVLRATIVPGIIGRPCFRAARPSRTQIAGSARPEFRHQPPPIAAGLLAISRRCSRSRPRRFRPDALDSPRHSNSCRRATASLALPQSRSASTRFTISSTPSPCIPPAPSATKSASARCSPSATFSARPSPLGFIFATPTIPVLILLFGLAGIHSRFSNRSRNRSRRKLLPAESRGSGFGVLATANGHRRFGFERRGGCAVVEPSRRRRDLFIRGFLFSRERVDSSFALIRSARRILNGDAPSSVARALWHCGQ